jgi:UDP-glucose 4-epimerase
MDAFAQVTGTDFTPVTVERRPGDPARIVASGESARRDLDWTMRHSLITLDSMIESAL